MPFNVPTRSAVSPFDTRAERRALTASRGTPLLPPGGIRAVQNTGSALRPGSDQALTNLKKTCARLRQLNAIQGRAAESHCPSAPVEENPSASRPLPQQPPLSGWNAEARSRSVQRPEASPGGNAMPQELREQASSTITNAARQVASIAQIMAQPTASTSRPLSETAKAIKEAATLTATCGSVLTVDLAKAAADVAKAAADLAKAAGFSETGTASPALQQAVGEPGSLEGPNGATALPTNPVESGMVATWQASAENFAKIDNFISYTDSLIADAQCAAITAETSLQQARQVLRENWSPANEQQCQSLEQIAQDARAEANTVESQIAQVLELVLRTKTQEHAQTSIQTSDHGTLHNAFKAVTQACEKAKKAAQEAQDLLTAMFQAVTRSPEEITPSAPPEEALWEVD